MRKYWWTVWIKVAVLAVALFLAYRFATGKIEQIISPYLIEDQETTSDVAVEDPEQTDDEGNIVMRLLGKVEDVLGVRIDFENLIFDFANEFAKGIKDDSSQERNPISESLT